MTNSSQSSGSEHRHHDTSSAYPIHFTSSHLEITEGIKAHVRGALEKVTPLVPQILNIKVHMEVEKMEHVIDIALYFSHFCIRVGAKTSDMYASIDKAIKRLGRKVHRWKEKIQAYHEKKVPIKEIPVEVWKADSPTEQINELIEEENRNKEINSLMPEIVERRSHSLKTLLAEEAVMKMELSRDAFLLYRSEEDHQLRLLYKRSDNTYGLMIPDVVVAD